MCSKTSDTKSCNARDRANDCTIAIHNGKPNHLSHNICLGLLFDLTFHWYFTRIHCNFKLEKSHSKSNQKHTQTPAKKRES